MKVIALSGGVASGKSYISDIFKEFGAKIFDADEANHDILAQDADAIDQIDKAFPGAVKDGIVDRKSLGAIVFGDKNKLKELESITHPLIKRRYQKFIAKAVEDKEKLVLLNIPLLLETGHYSYDFLLAIVTDLDIRKERYIKRESARTGRGEEELEKKFYNITSNQISNQERVKDADFVIDGGLSDEELREKIRSII